MGRWKKEFPLFSNFCDKNCNRREFLIDRLESEKIPYNILQINNSYHIVLFPDKLKSGSTLLIAHYDRVKGTPGANDNSASVMLLLKHSKKLLNIDHNTSIIFTDNEEIGDKASVKEQGAFGLGEYLKARELDPNIFIFDMCGIGTTLLLGTAGENLIRERYGKSFKSSPIKSKIESIKRRGEEVLLSSNYGEFFYLTPLFSDDLGLILNGYPSILISLLPYREAVAYQKDSSILPKSWRVNHTKGDTIDTLDPKSIDIILPLLEKLSGINSNKDFRSFNSSGSFKCYTQKLQKVEPAHPREWSSYIIESGLDLSNIKSINSERLEIFRLLSSNTTTDSIDKLYNVFSIKGDYSRSIYNYIKDLVERELSLLPIAIRNQLENLKQSSKSSSLTEFLYNNIMNNLKERGSTPVVPHRTKKDLSYTIKDGLYSLEYSLSYKGINICALDIIRESEGLKLAGGRFTNEFLDLDTLNLLKGIRTTLIKWAKLNNNKSLTIDLTPSRWVGGWNLVWLLSMELRGRSNRIWRDKWEQR